MPEWKVGDEIQSDRTHAFPRWTKLGAFQRETPPPRLGLWWFVHDIVIAWFLGMLTGAAFVTWLFR